MKFDYKPKMSQKGSPILRRVFHVGLGFVAVTCVLFSLPNKKQSQATGLQPAQQLATIETPTNISVTAPVVPVTPAAPTTVAIADPILDAVTPAAEPAPLEAPLATLLPVPTTSRTVKVRQGDTLLRIFSRLGIATRDIHELMTTNTSTRRLASLQPGQTLELEITPDQRIAALTLKIGPGNQMIVARTDTGFKVDHKLTPLEKQLAFGKGEIEDSLYSSGAKAGLDNRVLSQMVEIFGWNIDFALDLQPGDAFRVLYEAKYLDGEKVESGNILAAEIVNGREKHRAIRYTDKSGRTAYFSPEGHGMRQAFLRTPVQFSRISSHFGHRHHPVLHKLRKHKGVDYSAPRGTPVQATGDGTVTFMGYRGGYGKVVEIQHGSRYTTLYAHLDRFPTGLRSRQEIRQGQVIGYVGRTGLATGDHLHYEFRVDGIHCDPLTVALPRTNPLTEKNKRHFIAHAKEMLRLLDMHEHQVNMAQTDIYSSFSEKEEPQPHVVSAFGL